MTIMCFQRIYEDILKLVLKNGEKLYGKDLIQFVYSAAREVCFNFEKCLPEKYKCDFDLCREENAKKGVTVEEATKLKDEGTKFFRNNKLEEALDCYNRYLQLCHALKDEEVKNKMIYQAYANRSLVLFKGGKVSVNFPFPVFLYFLCVFTSFHEFSLFEFLVCLLPG